MNKHKPGREPIFDNAFKIAVAREFLDGNLGADKLAKKYKLKGHSTVQWFVKWYKKNYDQPSPLLTDKAPDCTFQKVDDRQLSKQLKEANLKIAGLEMLIEIAKKELGVDIVKKPGTKQSSK